MKARRIGFSISAILMLLAGLGILLFRTIGMKEARMHIVIIAAVSSVVFSLVSFIPLPDDLRLPLRMVMLLCIPGILEITRLQSIQGVKQVTWIAIGAILGAIIYKLYPFFLKFQFRFIGVMFIIFALFLITLKFGVVQGGAKNWIHIRGHFFQPSELIKLLFIMQLVWTRGAFPKDKPLPSLISFGSLLVYMGLFFLQRDLGGAAILYALYFFDVAIFEENRNIWKASLIVFLLLGLLAYYVFPHVATRFRVWMHPFREFQNKGYQIVTALVAMANGGFFGTGLSYGYPQVIPVAISDMMPAAIIEELGMITGIGMVALYAALSLFGFSRARHLAHPEMARLATLSSLYFSVQFFFILFGNFNILPLSGMTAPFVSYGGSSMIASSAILALMLRGLSYGYAS